MYFISPFCFLWTDRPASEQLDCKLGRRDDKKSGHVWHIHLKDRVLSSRRVSRQMRSFACGCFHLIFCCTSWRGLQVPINQLRTVSLHRFAILDDSVKFLGMKNRDTGHGRSCEGVRMAQSGLLCHVLFLRAVARWRLLYDR
jgi:hypothetical protein